MMRLKPNSGTDWWVCLSADFSPSVFLYTPPQWQHWKRTEVNNLIGWSTGQTCITWDCVKATNVLLTLTERDSFILSLTSTRGRVHRKLMFVSILVQWADRGIYLICSPLSHCCGCSLLGSDDALPDEDYDTLEIRENDFNTGSVFTHNTDSTQTKNQSIWLKGGNQISRRCRRWEMLILTFKALNENRI